MEANRITYLQMALEAIKGLKAKPLGVALSAIKAFILDHYQYRLDSAPAPRKGLNDAALRGALRKGVKDGLIKQEGQLFSLCQKMAYSRKRFFSDYVASTPLARNRAIAHKKNRLVYRAQGEEGEMQGAWGKSRKGEEAEEGNEKVKKAAMDVMLKMNDEKIKEYMVKKEGFNQLEQQKSDRKGEGRKVKEHEEGQEKLHLAMSQEGTIDCFELVCVDNHHTATSYDYSFVALGQKWYFRLVRTGKTWKFTKLCTYVPTQLSAAILCISRPLIYDSNKWELLEMYVTITKDSTFSADDGQNSYTDKEGDEADDEESSSEDDDEEEGHGFTSSIFDAEDEKEDTEEGKNECEREKGDGDQDSYSDKLYMSGEPATSLSVGQIPSSLIYIDEVGCPGFMKFKIHGFLQRK